MTDSSARRPVFYLCGDSLTQQGGELTHEGWCLLLQQSYLRSVDFVNRGLSGYDTGIFLSHAMPVIREELRSMHSPALITLWLGANDAALIDGPASIQHVPVSQYKQNLVAILREFRELAPQAKILLLSPPAVDDDKRRQVLTQATGVKHKGRLDRTNEQAGLYAAACSEVAAEIEGVVLLDIHTFLMATYPKESKRARLFRDGLHFSAEGNRVVFNQIKASIEKLLPATTLTTWQLPDWKALK